MPTESALLTPYELAGTTLRNRVVMSSMGRRRADTQGTPNQLMAQYYQQRASAGLVITESTHPARRGKGQTGSPHLYSRADRDGWAEVVSAVHEAGGKIIMQLQHAGSAAHPSVNGEQQPIAPSALRPQETTKVDGEMVPYPVPQEMSTDDIRAVINQYAASAALADDAGFDGVEIHAGNGFLPQQFLATGSNQRTDAYGGSVDNRCRFVLELVEAVSAVLGLHRVGLKISPGFTVNQIEETSLIETYAHLLSRPEVTALGYCHTSCFTDPAVLDWMTENWQSTWIHNAGTNPTEDAGTVHDGLLAARERGADLVSVGRMFIANPDLVARLNNDAPLNTPDPDTFYGGDATGYTDYPTSEHNRHASDLVSNTAW